MLITSLDGADNLCFGVQMGYRRDNLRQTQREEAFAKLDAIPLSELAGRTATRAAAIAATSTIYLRAWMKARGHHDLLAIPRQSKRQVHDEQMA